MLHFAHIQNKFAIGGSAMIVLRSQFILAALICIYDIDMELVMRLLALFDVLHLSSLKDLLVLFCKFTKVAFFEFAEMFHMVPQLALFRFSFHDDLLASLPSSIN